MTFQPWWPIWTEASSAGRLSKPSHGPDTSLSSKCSTRMTKQTNGWKQDKPRWPYSIPPDLEQRIKSRRTALVGILIDGVDTTTAGTVSGYAQSILQRFALDIMDQRMNQMQGQLFRDRHSSSYSADRG